MDKNILIQYADMQQEVKDIRRRIDDTERKINKMLGGNSERYSAGNESRRHYWID